MERQFSRWPATRTKMGRERWSTRLVQMRLRPLASKPLASWLSSRRASFVHSLLGHLTDHRFSSTHSIEGSQPLPLANWIHDARSAQDGHDLSFLIVHATAIVLALSQFTPDPPPTQDSKSEKTYDPDIRTGGDVLHARLPLSILPAAVTSDVCPHHSFCPPSGEGFTLRPPQMTALRIYMPLPNSTISVGRPGNIWMQCQQVPTQDEFSTTQEVVPWAEAAYLLKWQ